MPRVQSSKIGVYKYLYTCMMTPGVPVSILANLRTLGVSLETRKPKDKILTLHCWEEELSIMHRHCKPLIVAPSQQVKWAIIAHAQLNILT